MKYLFLITISFIAYSSNAQNSKPYYNFPIDSKCQTITDTSQGFITAKWAIMDMYSITSNLGIITAYFDNGSCVNLLPLFKADTALLRNNHIYFMAALEYMDKHGFRLIGLTENSYTFQRK